MQFSTTIDQEWISTFINAQLISKTDIKASGINEIHKVQKGDISFVDFEKYYEKCLQSDATFIIINKEVDCPEGKALFVCDDPFEAYVKLVKHFRPFQPSHQMISDTALIGPDSVIMPGSFIGNHVIIGKNCIIHPNVTIYDYSEIGDNVIIHAGTVLGADAFYLM